MFLVPALVVKLGVFCMSMNLQGASRALGFARKSAGFTLVEAMTAVVIFSILMAVGIPAVNRMMEGQRTRSVAADLHTSLTLARAEAVVRNRPVTVSPLGAGGDWGAEGWQVTVGSGADLIVLQRQDVEPDQVKITPDPATSEIEFRPNGRANTTVALEIESARDGDGSPKRCVEVGLDGRARSQLGGCDE